MKSDFQQELLRTQLEIQEQTLKNIGQEIHDNIGQTLSLVKLNLNTIDTEKPTGWQEKILNSKELVSKAILDLRSISKTLNTDAILTGGLATAIEFELNLIEKAGEVHTVLEVEGKPAKLDPKKELILFRIVQEALNNIIKHSGAHTISVRIHFRENKLMLSIGDSGQGFLVENLDAAETGSGLRNMRNRAELIGANLEIRSKLNQGTTIFVTIPTIES